MSSQTSQTRLVKSGKSNIDSKSSRKATLVVRRLIDGKGFHIGTEVDIKSSRLAKVLQETNPDVEGVSLTAIPLKASIQIYCNWHNSTRLNPCRYHSNEMELEFRHQPSFSTTTGPVCNRGSRRKRKHILATRISLTN